MWVYPHLLYDDGWLAESSSKSNGRVTGKGKGKAEVRSKSAFSNVVSLSSRKIDSDFISYPKSEDNEEVIVFSAQTEVPMIVATRSGNHTTSNIMMSLVPHSYLLLKS